MLPPGWEILLGPVGVVALCAYATWLLWQIHKKDDADRDAEHAKQLAEKDNQVEFVNSLRLEAIADKRAIEDRSSAQTDAIKELTNVVRQSIELTGTLAGESFHEWDGSERRRNSKPTHPRARRDTPSSQRIRRGP